MNSKQKGNRGERELAAILKEYGYESRRGHQFNGKTDEADVIGVPGLHIECKRVEQLNLEKALEQSKGDARPNEFATVFHRRNREEWKVTVRLHDFMELWEEHEKMKKIKERVEKEKEKINKKTFEMAKEEW